MAGVGGRSAAKSPRETERSVAPRMGGREEHPGRLQVDSTINRLSGSNSTRQTMLHLNNSVIPVRPFSLSFYCISIITLR